MKRKSLLISSLIIIFSCLPGLSFSQSGPFDNNGTATTNDPPPPPPDPVDTPFDGGLLILISAGVVYGFKKYRKNAIAGQINNS